MSATLAQSILICVFVIVLQGVRHIVIPEFERIEGSAPETGRSTFIVAMLQSKACISIACVAVGSALARPLADGIAPNIEQALVGTDGFENST